MRFIRRLLDTMQPRKNAMRQVVHLLEVLATGDRQFTGAPEHLECDLLRPPSPPRLRWPAVLIEKIARAQRPFPFDAFLNVPHHLERVAPQARFPPCAALRALEE